MRVLLAQRDPASLDRLQEAFEAEDFVVDRARTAGEAEDRIDRVMHDAIILGRRLAEGDGVELCRELRQRGMDTPIIILADVDGTEPTVDALDAGADDYVARPVELEELFARVRAVLRRGTDEEGDQLSYEGIVLDLPNRTATIDDTPLVLTPREFSLLEYFIRNRERVVTREALADSVWGRPPGSGRSNVVDVYVSRVRKKLRALDKDTIHTVHRMGYMFAATPPLV